MNVSLKEHKEAKRLDLNDYQEFMGDTSLYSFTPSLFFALPDPSLSGHQVASEEPEVLPGVREESDNQATHNKLFRE